MLFIGVIFEIRIEGISNESTQVKNVMIFNPSIHIISISTGATLT
jgi:hypothetical protein